MNIQGIQGYENNLGYEKRKAMEHSGKVSMEEDMKNSMYYTMTDHQFLLQRLTTALLGL